MCEENKLLEKEEKMNYKYYNVLIAGVENRVRYDGIKYEVEYDEDEWYEIELTKEDKKTLQDEFTDSITEEEDNKIINDL